MDIADLVGAAFATAGAGLIIGILSIILALLIFWMIIRSAVRHALRDHQTWMERRLPVEQPQRVAVARAAPSGEPDRQWSLRS